MPIYEYRCRNCNEKFEKLIFGTISDEEIVCPKCEKQQSERLISACATIGSSVPVSNSTSGCGSNGFT